VTFNWNYPDEEFTDVSVLASSPILESAWFNVSDMYQVENDLVFTGTLVVTNSDLLTIENNDLVRGKETLTWSGLIPVYEGTTDVFPLEDECDVSIWNSAGSSWYGSPLSGEPLYIETTAAPLTNLYGDTHTINISGIPPGSDATDETFTIKIDGENVSFSDFTPENNSWVKSQVVECSVTISDTGGALVDPNVMYTSSTDNGTTWESWKSVIADTSAPSILIEDSVGFAEGVNNLLKWKAKDTVGNGPVESEVVRLLVDTEDVVFSDLSPEESYVSPIEQVEVNVTILDETSGVDASTVQYTTSTDGGTTWSPWMDILGIQSGLKIDIGHTISFPNGTENRVKWRAKDIAGNGPMETKALMIKVNTWIPTKLKTVLLSPKNGSVTPRTTVDLLWNLDAPNFSNVLYDVYIDTQDPPRSLHLADTIETTTEFTAAEGVIYYWTVIPKLEEGTGSCVSGIWSFSYDPNVVVPSVILISPIDNAVTNQDSIELRWQSIGDGTGWKYEIYLDEVNPPGTIVAQDHVGTTLTVNRLEHSKMYYWTVVPISAEKIPGIYGETIWSFSVNFEATPADDYGFDVELTPPNDLTIPQGRTAEVSALIKNTGSVSDNYVVSIEAGPLQGHISITGNSEVSLEAMDHDTLLISISVPLTTAIGDYPVTVSASSKDALMFGLNITEKANFTIHVLDASEGSTQRSEKDLKFTERTIFWVLVIIVVIAIVAVVAYLFLRTGKSKSDKERAEDAEFSSDVQLGGPPTHVPPNIPIRSIETQAQPGTPYPYSGAGTLPTEGLRPAPEPTQPPQIGTPYTRNPQISRTPQQYPYQQDQKKYY